MGVSYLTLSHSNVQNLQTASAETKCARRDPSRFNRRLLLYTDEELQTEENGRRSLIGVGIRRMRRFRLRLRYLSAVLIYDFTYMGKVTVWLNEGNLSAPRRVYPYLSGISRFYNKIL